MIYATRVCKTCGFRGNMFTDFPKAGVIKEVTYYRHVCNTCYLKQKNEYKQLQQQKFYDWKKTLKCEQCGFDDWRALDFHHHNNDKDFSIGNVMNRGFSFETVLKEAKKCTVLCANCHRILHSNHDRE